ncbi:hypothetical protein [Gloeobacter violaceus]|uniref:Glr3907 protein n=1 Tax=Gloeobacter violaceus (strain ATCC 29082 / PCC 7421) TaxID=251221 RepID=Q7NEH2_GLOVI|nr:hypothetical protein [Gloeobacter violaceus]BAC91848.1 glr3907 [Gloeobacter violaceus PCC 7421]
MKRIAAFGLALAALVLPAAAAPLAQIEPVEGEKEKMIRISAQGPLPFEVLEKSASSLVLFLPRAELGNAPALLSLAPLANLTLEQNPVGVRVIFENLKTPFLVRAGKKPGIVEISFPEPPPPPPPSATTTQKGRTGTPGAPGLPGSAGTAQRTGVQPAGTLQPSDIEQGQLTDTSQVGKASEIAEEEPDPPRPGIAPMPPRPNPPRP